MSDFKLPEGKHQPRTKLSQSRYMVAGPPGIGKTFFASQWPNALFLATEPGAHLMSVAEGEIRSWDAFNSAMDKLEYTKHPSSSTLSITCTSDASNMSAASWA